MPAWVRWLVMSLTGALLMSACVLHSKGERFACFSPFNSQLCHDATPWVSRTKDDDVRLYPTPTPTE